MAVDLDLGDTRMIIDKCRFYGVLRNQAAYLLATAYWETAHTMKPVVEAYWLSEQWRKSNLRYYPWHGRGHVQCTWEKNYQRVKRETGQDVISDPDLMLRDSDLSADVLVIGCMSGWWTGKSIPDYLTLERSDYVGARRVVNGTDKAHAIAELAREYETALLAIGYGVEKSPPVVNERRDGSAPRTTPLKSTTAQAVTAATVVEAAKISDQVTGVIGTVTERLGVSPEFALSIVTIVALGWIFRERLRKWAAGDR